MQSPAGILDQLKLLAFHIQSHQIALGGLNLVAISEKIPQLQQHLNSLQQLQTVTNAHIASLNSSPTASLPAQVPPLIQSPPSAPSSPPPTVPSPPKNPATSISALLAPLSQSPPSSTPSPSISSILNPLSQSPSSPPPAPSIASILNPLSQSPSTSSRTAPAIPPAITSKPAPILPAPSKPAPTVHTLPPSAATIQQIAPPIPLSPATPITVTRASQPLTPAHPPLTRTTSAPLPSTPTRSATPSTSTTTTTTTTTTSPSTPAAAPPLLVPVPAPPTPVTPARGRKRALAASESAVKTPAKKKATEKTPVEIRRSPYKKRTNQNIRDRIARASSEKLWVVDRKIVETTPEEKAREREFHCEFSVPKQIFVVLGSTGNVYNVTIHYQPACTCPDFLKGNLCKHIFFVYIKVLKVPPTSELLFQSALTSSELTQIFTNAPLEASILADKRVRAEYSHLVNPSAPKDAPNAPKQRPVEGDCPVCFDPMKSTEQIEFCKECGNNVHKTCWEKWSTTKKQNKIQATCIYCRAPWDGADRVAGKTAVINEGYLNLASLQPHTSTERDYDQYEGFRYNSGYGFGGRGYGYGHGRRGGRIIELD